jgi:hypothetical protein
MSDIKKIIFWIIWVSLAIACYFLAGTFLRPSLMFDSPEAQPAPVGAELVQVQFLSTQFHLIEVLIRFLISGLIMHIALSLHAKYKDEKKTGIPTLNKFNLGTYIFMILVFIYFVLKTSYSFFITDFQIEGINVINYLINAYILVVYAYYLFIFQRVLNLKTKGLISLFPLAAVVLYLFQADPVIYQIANIVGASGTILVFVMYITLAKNSLGEIRKRSIFMAIGFILLVSSVFFNLNVNLSWMIWNGAAQEIVLIWGELFFSVFHGPIYAIVGCLFFNIGMKTPKFS